MVAPSRVVEHFASELKERLGEKILGIYLFGSTAKGTATEESDMDVLVVYSDIEEWSLLEAASEISFKIEALARVHYPPHPCPLLDES